jgi:hypothetical protein
MRMIGQVRPSRRALHSGRGRGEAGVVLPPAIEDGRIPPHDLGEYHNPLVVLVPYAALVTA